MYAWVDAGSQNRPDGGSTQGIVVGLGSSNMQNGELGHVNLISWHSNRIDRACRSPGAAETQAAVNGEDCLYFARFQRGELLQGVPDVRAPDEVVKSIPGCVVTDSRNVFDRLSSEVLAIKGAEKRTSIELIALKESQQQTNLVMRWVHSEAQLANSLTKAGGSKELELFYRMNFQWKIVEDPEMRSARRRKAQGLDPLDRSSAEKNTEATTDINFSASAYRKCDLEFLSIFEPFLQDGGRDGFKWQSHYEAQTCSVRCLRSYECTSLHEVGKTELRSSQPRPSSYGHSVARTS